MERHGECPLANAAAGTRQLDADCLGQSRFHHSSHRKGQSPHVNVFRPRQRQAALAIGRYLRGEGSDPCDQSLLFRFASHGWPAGDCVLCLGGTLLLRLQRKGALASRPRQTGAHLGQRCVADSLWRPLHSELRAGRKDVPDRAGQKNRQDDLAGKRAGRRFR